MSNLDYLMGQQQGASLGRLRAAHAENEASETIAQWKKYAGQLKSKVDAAEQKAIFEEAKYKGAAFALDAALEELRRVNPNSPLLDAQQLRKIKASVVVPTLAQYGYDYDPVTNDVTKRG